MKQSARVPRAVVVRAAAVASERKKSGPSPQGPADLKHKAKREKLIKALKRLHPMD